MTGRTQESPNHAVATTPTVRAFLRKSSFWIVVAVGALIATLVLLLVTNQGNTDRRSLSTNSTGPGGSMAVAEVLRQQGVALSRAGTLEEAIVAARADSTVLFYDPNGYLSSSQLSKVATLGNKLVVITPAFFELAQLAPEIFPAGKPEKKDELSADCDLPAALKAEKISVSGSTYRIENDSVGDDEVDQCFSSYDDSYSLIRLVREDRSVTVLGAPDVLSNEGILKSGNAALALNLLGESENLVWYIPTAADVEATGPPSLSELTPDWVTAVLLLLLFVFISAAIWRGRRLGPVVIENLPVTVRSTETREGRARLYAKAGAYSRATDAIRIGTLRRISSMLGLPRTTQAPEIITAIAQRTGIHPEKIAATLLEQVPRSEAEMMQISQELEHYEALIRSATTVLDPNTARTLKKDQ